MSTKKDIPYLERLRSELVDGISRQQQRRPAVVWWKTRAAALVAATLVVVAAGAVSAVVLTGGPSADVSGPTDRGGGAAASCVEQFSVDTLALRDFAFDGAISEVVPPANPEAEGPAAATEVIFEVHRWYKGGSGDTATVKTYEQPGVISSVEGSLDLTVGTRLLASGDDVFLWSCGFSMPYTEANARLFAQAFGE
ncbi:MAG: hypothetical protein ACRDGU_02390 [Actinomycetota bacterium]